MLKLSRLGKLQVSALEIYVFDPIHEPFPGSLSGSTLIVNDADAAGAMLCEAANSADCDGDAELRDALTALAGRAWALVSAK